MSDDRPSETCAVCGRRAYDPGALPPELEPVRLSLAVADYTGTVCNECRGRPLNDILDHLHGRPGGVVKGKARVPYLVAPEEE